jgi:hypothetical protein
MSMETCSSHIDATFPVLQMSLVNTATFTISVPSWAGV